MECSERSVMQKTESVKQLGVSTLDITKPSSRSGHGATKPRPPLKPRDLAQRSITWTQASGVEQLPTCGTSDDVKCVTTSSEDDVGTAATASVSTADECSTFHGATSGECSPSNKAILRRRSARPRLAPPPPPPKKPTAESQHNSPLTDSQSRVPTIPVPRPPSSSIEDNISGEYASYERIDYENVTSEVKNLWNFERVR
uniref:Uncharacterized protein n=1 Tax=Angiostrongylus cantonensis TaxID=6313 RepID=A0A0K0DFH5_ANGCA